MTRDEFLGVAVRIGRRLVEQAMWKDEACTWKVWRPEGNSVALIPASGELYQGAGGIALFLGELFKYTGEESFGRTAAGGIVHALSSVSEISESQFGFYSGRVGIAATAVRLGRLLERSDFIMAGEDLVENLAGHESRDVSLDVVGGAAGAIPAMIELAQELDSDRPLEIATALGDHLLATAHREPGGWSWPVFAHIATRHLTGFSHGAAGIGLALLELAAATRRDRYRFAAEMAFLYERQFFDDQERNWLDLRHKELSELRQEGDSAVRQAARRGEIESYRPTFMTAWCHGAPGIGLSRLRAYELTGQAIYRDEAETALRSTLDALGRPHPSGDFSLCHGVAGFCELLLEASETFDWPELTGICEWQATQGWETFEQRGRPWLCGTQGRRNDPSLLVGEAGIGYFYMRLAISDLPPILCPRVASITGTMHLKPSEDFQALARESVEAYFDTTLEALVSLEGEAQTAGPEVESPILTSPVEEACARLERRVAASGDPHEEALRQAFDHDRQRYEMTLGITDFTAEYLYHLIRPDWAEVSSHRGGSDLARFRLAEHCRLVDAEQLLFRQGNRILSREPGPLVAAILEALPGTIADVVDHLGELDDGADPLSPEELRALVEGQIEQLYVAGLIDLVDETESTVPELRESTAEVLHRAEKAKSRAIRPIVSSVAV